VQHINSLGKTDCVDGATGVSGAILDDLQHTCAFYPKTGMIVAFSATETPPATPPYLT
jgi:hypothetical protein